MTPYHGSSQARNYKLYDFVAHGSAVTCLALGQKSGRVMVTGGDDAKVNLWAVGKPNCIMSLHGHKTSVECAKFNYSEDVVGAGSASGAIKLWDLEAVKLIQTLTGHRTNVRCLDFHPYGQFLASGSFDTSIKLWDYRKKGCIYTYKIHSNEVHCLRLSPDGRWLASGGADGSVLLYDIVASKVLAELKQGGHSAAVTDLVFHPNEFLLASGSLDGTVKFWDLESFAQVSSSSSSSASGGYLGPVRKVAFHPEGRALLAAGRDALKVYGWEPTVLYDSVDVHWSGGNGGRLADMAVLEGQLVAGSCSRAATDASVYLVDIASLRPFCGGEEKGRKGDGLDDEGLLGDQATTFPRNTLRQSTRRSFNFDQSSKTCKHLESLESNKSNSSGGDDQLETATVSSDGDGEAGSAAEIFSTCDYKEIFHSRRELCRTPPVDDSPAPTADAIVGSLPPSYSVASFATTNSSSSSSSPSSSSSNSSSSGKSLTGIAPITSRGRHPTLNASMKTGISESLTNLAASYKNNNLGLHLNLNLNNNTSVHLNQQQQLSHASSLSGLNHLKVGGGDYHHHPNPNQTAHQHFPALLSPTAKPPPPPPPPPVNQHYPVLTPIPPLSSALNNNSSSSHHHNSTRNHNLPNKITSVVRPVVNDGASGGGGGAHRPPLSQTVRPQPKTDNHQAGRINRDRSTSTSNIVSTIAAGDHHHNNHHHHHHHHHQQQQPSSQFIIPDTRDGHSSGLLDYNDFLPKHIVQYGYDAQPPLTELEALAAIGGKGHRAAKASLDYRRRQVAIVLAMWATKDARTALEYAVNLDEKSVVIDILNVMVLKASTWNLDICLILLPCIQELLESKYESYMSVGCSALSLILKTFSSVIKNSIAAPPGIGVDISREERYNKCMKCYNHLLSARAFVLKRQTLQGKIGRSFRELSILMQNLE